MGRLWWFMVGSGPQTVAVAVAVAVVVEGAMDYLIGPDYFSEGPRLNRFQRRVLC